MQDLLDKLDISKEATRQPNKKRSKQKQIKGLQTLDKFLLKELPLSRALSPISANSNVKIMSSTPVRDEINTSCHYISDDSAIGSPLRKTSQVYKRSKSLEDIVKEVMKSNDNAENVTQPSDCADKQIQTKDSVENAVQYEDLAANGRQSNASFSANFNSFLEDSVIDDSAFNLSNIVDSILARTNSNPAYQIWCQKYN